MLSLLFFLLDPLLTSQVFCAQEVVDGSVTLIKNSVCGTVIDHDRILLGAEEGLFCVDLENSGEWSRLGKFLRRAFACAIF